MRPGLLVVLSGPSGVGKGTVSRRLLQQDPRLRLSISWTTRAIRPGDVEGQTYFFHTDEEFLAMAGRGGFLEWAGVYGKRYGTPADFVRSVREGGQDCLLEIDPQGALQVMEKVPEAVSIYLLPPSMEELRRRLLGRATETPEQLGRRYEAAAKEMEFSHLYRYRVVNDDVESAVRQIQTILESERARAKEQQV